MPLIVLDRQVLIDMCLESTGDMARLFDTANANGQSITWYPDPGEACITVVPAAERKALLKVFADRSNAPASADMDGAVQLPGGIDYMQVGNDFRVR
jgi:phospholipase C